MACGRLMSNDCARMECLRVFCKHRHELRDAAIYDNKDFKTNKSMGRTSLKNLSLKHLGINLQKVHRNEDWSQSPLPITLQRHAALDSLVSR